MKDKKLSLVLHCVLELLYYIIAFTSLLLLHKIIPVNTFSLKFWIDLFIVCLPIRVLIKFTQMEINYE